MGSLSPELFAFIVLGYISWVIVADLTHFEAVNRTVAGLVGCKKAPVFAVTCVPVHCLEVTVYRAGPKLVSQSINIHTDLHHFSSSFLKKLKHL